MPYIEGDDGAARAYYVRLLPLYTMETRRVQLCTQQKLRYLEIVHQCRAISRLRTGAAQSRDCVNPVRDWHAISGSSRLRKFLDCAEHISFQIVCAQNKLGICIH